MYDEICMYFNPASFRIEILWSELKHTPDWKRQTIGLFAHELVHVYQWLIVYRKNALQWNEADKRELERPAERVQDIVLNLLGIGIF